MVGPVAGNGAASSSDATTSRSGTAHSDIGVALRVQVEELRRDNARLAELVRAKTLLLHESRPSLPPLFPCILNPASFLPRQLHR